MKLNLNDQVKVKFTEHGWIIYNAHYNKYGIPPIEIVEPDGYCRMQLGLLANIFGPYMGNGLKLPIETEIEIVKNV